MTKVKTTTAIMTKNGKTITQDEKYFEVGGHELDQMMERVAKGENEEELRNELIKNSIW